MATYKSELTSPTDQLLAPPRSREIIDALPGSGFVATATNLPRSQTAKILQQMTWAGFVESRRGTKGGFWLVKPAGRTRVADIVAFFTHPAPSEEQKDPIAQALVRITEPCRKEFSRITVADLARLSSCTASPSATRRNAPREKGKTETNN